MSLLWLKKKTLCASMGLFSVFQIANQFRDTKYIRSASLHWNFCRSVIQLSIFHTTYPAQGNREALSISQGTWDTRRATPWMECQLRKAQLHTFSHIHMRTYVHTVTFISVWSETILVDWFMTLCVLMSSYFVVYFVILSCT